MIYDADFQVAQAFYDELQKIAYAMSPDELASAVKTNLSARKAGRISLREMLSLDGRSALGGLIDNTKSWLGGGRVRKRALRELEQRRNALNPGAAGDIGEQNRRLQEIARIRDAERSIVGAGKERTGNPFFSSGASKGGPTSLGSVAFGAGLGGAGLYAGQRYLQGRQEPQY